MFRLMASGEPVVLTSPMSSLKKVSRLAFVAEQFGYQYVDARYSGGRNAQLQLFIAPDPSPQARRRAAQSWAMYPHAAEAGALPPLQPEAVELLKARAKFDLTGKNAEQRMLYGIGGVTLASVILAFRFGGESGDFVIAGVIWAALMVLVGIGFVVNRHRNAKFAARLQGMGFVPVTDETGRLRYLPPGSQVGPPLGTPLGAPVYPSAYPPSTPSPYAQGPYAPQMPQQYGQPQQPYGQYGQPNPNPNPYTAPHPGPQYPPSA
ncbi:hypothetical protein ABZ953_17205 [Streptomyces sp. NPDC046465]|uniref:hypothetical protein n=1 Tax=Streptomyces sp. NPDC046465 TaxID=3155810 RepID=UPI0033FA3816